MDETLDIEEQEPLYSFEKEIDVFIEHIESLNGSLPIIMTFLISFGVKADDDYTKFCETKGFSKEDLATKDLDWESYKILKELAGDLNILNIASRIVPQSLLVSLVSQFDAYIGRLIRTIFFVKPEILNSSEKNIKFSDLLEFQSIETAREFIIEKEVESVLRSSHEKQFDWLEDKLGMTLRKGLDVWPDFIEITERRNLFVHCNGVVSSQYLSICKKHKVVFDKTFHIKDNLQVTPKYFVNAYKCFFVIGVKLAHVIWRKLRPQEREQADKNLNSVTYDLLLKEEYELANILLDFATNLPEFSNEEYRLMFLINKSQSKKWMGDREAALQLISSEDWSACSYKFKIAIAVLKDEFEEAARIMRILGGASEEVTKDYYKDWPIFKEFRKTTEFLSTYEEIFSEKYTVTEVPGTFSKLVRGFKYKKLKIEPATIDIKD